MDDVNPIGHYVTSMFADDLGGFFTETSDHEFMEGAESYGALWAIVLELGDGVLDFRDQNTAMYDLLKRMSEQYSRGLGVDVGDGEATGGGVDEAVAAYNLNPEVAATLTSLVHDALAEMRAFGDCRWSVGDAGGYMSGRVKDSVTVLAMWLSWLRRVGVPPTRDEIYIIEGLARLVVIVHDLMATARTSEKNGQKNLCAVISVDEAGALLYVQCIMYRLQLMATRSTATQVFVDFVRCHYALALTHKGYGLATMLTTWAGTKKVLGDDEQAPDLDMTLNLVQGLVRSVTEVSMCDYARDLERAMGEARTAVLSYRRGETTSWRENFKLLGTSVCAELIDNKVFKGMYLDSVTPMAAMYALEMDSGDLSLEQITAYAVLYHELLRVEVEGNKDFKGAKQGPEPLHLRELREAMTTVTGCDDPRVIERLMELLCASTVRRGTHRIGRYRPSQPEVICRASDLSERAKVYLRARCIDGWWTLLESVEDVRCSEPRGAEEQRLWDTEGTIGSVGFFELQSMRRRVGEDGHSGLLGAMGQANVTKCFVEELQEKAARQVLGFRNLKRTRTRVFYLGGWTGVMAAVEGSFSHFCVSAVRRGVVDPGALSGGMQSELIWNEKAPRATCSVSQGV
ncbi:hypothetical protein BGX27_003844, partial [Mortierella sp. AM989]